MLYNIDILGEKKCEHNEWSAWGYIDLHSFLKLFRPCLQDTKSPGKKRQETKTNEKIGSTRFQIRAKYCVS